MPKFDKEKLTQEATKRNQENFFSNEESFIWKDLYDQGRKLNSITGNLTAILDKPCTFVDDRKNKTTRTVSGTEEMKEIFGATSGNAAEFQAKPFRELGRTQEAHFLVYCISKGMSEDRLMRLATENVSEEDKKYFDDMKTDYYSMIMNKDSEERVKECAEMYTNYANRAEELIQKAGKAIKEKNYPEMIKYSAMFYDVNSSLFQTFGNGIKDPAVEAQETPELKALLGMIDKNRIRGIDAVEGIFASINSKLTDFGRRNEGKIDEIREREMTYAFQANMNIADEVMNLKSTGYQDFIEDSEKTVGGKALLLMSGMKPDEKTGEVRMVTKDELANMRNNLFSKKEDASMGTLKTQLENNHRLNWRGKQKDHSPKYKKVIEALEKFDVQGGDINAKYDDVISACKTYLDNRTPRSIEGQERYVLVSQVMEMAKIKRESPTMENQDIFELRRSNALDGDKLSGHLGRTNSKELQEEENKENGIKEHVAKTNAVKANDKNKEQVMGKH